MKHCLLFWCSISLLCPLIGYSQLFINEVSQGASGSNEHGLWSNGFGEQFQTGLCDGTYDVTVTDANGCVSTGTVVLP